MEETRPYEEVEHTADWAFRVRGRDLGELFAHAAQALSGLERDLASGEAAAGQPVDREVELEAVDREALLVAWLNEVLYLEQSNGESYHRFDILDVGEQRLRARLHGRRQANLSRRIKAVTFSGLEVKSTAEGYEATVVVDV